MSHLLAHFFCLTSRIRHTLALCLVMCLWILCTPWTAHGLPAPASLTAVASQVTATVEAQSPAPVVSPPDAAPEKLAPPEAVTTSVTPSSVQLGEPFTLTIQITHPEGFTYVPAGDFGLGKDADVLSVKLSTKAMGSGAEVTSIEVKGAVFNLGDVKLPDLSLIASNGITEEPFSVEGPSVTCTGKLAEGEKAPMNDILSPVSVNIPSYVILWVVLLVLALVGLFFLGLKLWRNRKPRVPKVVSGPPPAPVDVRALNALRELLAEGCADQGQSQQRQMFFRLSEIERGYLGERYNFGALDMTSEELLAALRKRHTPGLELVKLEARCREGDYVRYAKASLPASECVQAINDSMDMVMKTSACEADRLRGEEATQAAMNAQNAQSPTASDDVPRLAQGADAKDTLVATKLVVAPENKPEQTERQS